APRRTPWCPRPPVRNAPTGRPARRQACHRSCRAGRAPGARIRAPWSGIPLPASPPRGRLRRLGAPEGVDLVEARKRRLAALVQLARIGALQRLRGRLASQHAERFRPAFLEGLARAGEQLLDDLHVPARRAEGEAHPLGAEGGFRSGGVGRHACGELAVPEAGYFFCSPTSERRWPILSRFTCRYSALSSECPTSMGTRSTTSRS